jgi:hypothetical protein
LRKGKEKRERGRENKGKVGSGAFNHERETPGAGISCFLKGY